MAKSNSQPRPKRRLKDPDVFFTLKVYSQITGRKDRSLKFTLDFNSPFQANVDDLEPFYVSPLDAKNLRLFEDILKHVNEVYRYVSDPINYRPKDRDYKLTDEGSPRRKQQERLMEILKLTEGRIDRIFYEQASANRVGVSATALSDGNGDPRPPKI